MQELAPGAVRWHCRRGMKELDVLLERWLDRRWARAGPQARLDFVRLLEQPDTQLAAWLLQGTSPPDAGLESLVDEILRSHD